jgi:hypothetical protein
MKLKISLLLSLILNSPISGHQELRSIEFFVYSQSRLEGLHFRTLQKNPRTDPVQIRPIPIKSHYLHSTGPYAYYGTPELSFFHANSKQELANLKLKADTPTKLLVFLDNPDYGIAANALRYRIVPFSLNPQRAVAGQLSFLNLSGLQVVAKVNDHILHLKPNSQLSCRSESQVELQIALAGPQGQWILGWKKRFQLPENSAQAMLFFPPVLAGSSQLDVRRIQFEVQPSPELGE